MPPLPDRQKAHRPSVVAAAILGLPVNAASSARVPPADNSNLPLLILLVLARTFQHQDVRCSKCRVFGSWQSRGLNWIVPFCRRKAGARSVGHRRIMWSVRLLFGRSAARFGCRQAINFRRGKGFQLCRTSLSVFAVAANTAQHDVIGHDNPGQEVNDDRLQNGSKHRRGDRHLRRPNQQEPSRHQARAFNLYQNTTQRVVCLPPGERSFRGEACWMMASRSRLAPDGFARQRVRQAEGDKKSSALALEMRELAAGMNPATRRLADP